MPVAGFAMDATGDGKILGLDLPEPRHAVCDCFPVKVHGDVLVWKVPPGIPPKDFAAAVLTLFISNLHEALCVAEVIVAKFGVGDGIKFLYGVFESPKEPCVVVPVVNRIEDLERRGLLCFTQLDSPPPDLEEYGLTRR